MAFGTAVASTLTCREGDRGFLFFCVHLQMPAWVYIKESINQSEVADIFKSFPTNGPGVAQNYLLCSAYAEHYTRKSLAVILLIPFYIHQYLISLAY